MLLWQVCRVLSSWPPTKLVCTQCVCGLHDFGPSVWVHEPLVYPWKHTICTSWLVVLDCVVTTFAAERSLLEIAFWIFGITSGSDFCKRHVKMIFLFWGVFSFFFVCRFFVLYFAYVIKYVYIYGAAHIHTYILSYCFSPSFFISISICPSPLTCWELQASR